MKKTIKFLKATSKIEVILKRQLVQLKGGGKIKKKEPKAG